MRKLGVFNNVSLDGYFTDRNGDLSWAHAGSDDPEFAAFIAENATGGGTLLMGRKTYDLMAGYWPTPEAAKSAPEVARGMNAHPKVVFSKTLDRAAWSNTRIVHADPAQEARRLKKESDTDLMVLGSGTIVSQLSAAGLIDEYQLVVSPVVLGEGRTMFDGLDRTLPLRLTKTRSFRNGKVFLSYEAGA